MRKLTVGVVGFVVAAVAAYVAVGMIGGANPNFSKGRSPTGSVVVQELAGALTLAALGIATAGLVSVARGKHAGWRLVLLPVGLALAFVWGLALSVERAS
jgi:hypothetical protein